MGCLDCSCQAQKDGKETCARKEWGVKKGTIPQWPQDNIRNFQALHPLTEPNSFVQVSSAKKSVRKLVSKPGSCPGTRRSGRKSKPPVSVYQPPSYEVRYNLPMLTLQLH